MALVIDTGDLAETERLDTLAEVLRGSTGVAAAMDPVDPAGPVAAVVHLWQLGPGANLRVQSGTGFRLRRTARHVRMGGPEALCLTLRHGGRFRVVQHEA